MRILESYFQLEASRTNVSTELRAGITTFLTMAYILFVNPDILSKAIQIEGVALFPQLMCATAIAAAVGSLLMGLLAKYPFAMAPGMGLNAYFAFSVVLGQQVAWQSALAAVFVAGLIFVLLSVTGLRVAIVDAIPLSIKRAMVAGIGMFLAIIGLSNGGIIKASPATLVQIGDLSQGKPLIAFAGLIIMTALLALKVRGAILIGIVAATVVAMLSGADVYPGGSFAGFTNGIVQLPVWPKDIFMALSFDHFFSISMGGVIFAILFVDFFDTAGTLYGISHKAGFLDEKGSLPRANKAFLSDAIATSVGSLFGSSPTTTYIESASGIEEGGRTGLTAVFVAILFLISLFFWPLAGAVPGAATAPALILVGAMMMGGTLEIEWHDYRKSIPAFLTIIGMPLTYSISNGIALGIISYTLIHLISGKQKDVHWVMYVLSVLLGIMLLQG